MFVVTRSFTLKKGHYQDMIENFKNGQQPEGVVRREIHLNDIKIDRDVLTFVSYWKDKETFTEWHKAAHADKGPKKERPDHIIDVVVEKAVVIG